MEVWFQSGRRSKSIEGLLGMAESLGLPVKFIDKDRLDRKADGVHQGVLALVRAATVYRENDLYDQLEQLDHPPFLLILDSVTDPHNLGACLRSADAAGVDAVVVARDRSAPLNATVCKVACGAAETVPLVTVTNLVRTIKELQKRGIWMVGASGEADNSLYRASLSGPLAVVMGSESKGLRRLTREQCDTLVHIPMCGTVSSLNVSVATGICLFEALRQRGDVQGAGEDGRGVTNRQCG